MDGLQKLHKSRISFGFRELVFGVHDGVLTVLGFVSGAAGILTSSSIVFLAGLAAVVAEGISMGVGEYQSSKSYSEIIEAEKKKEKTHIKEIPEIEEKEIVSIYMKKGFTEKEAKKIAKKLMANQSVWFQTIMSEEYGIGPKQESILKNSAIMGVASFLGGFIPIIPYLFFDVVAALRVSIIFSALTLFIVGAGKTYYTKKNWFTSGIVMVMVAMLTALVTFYIGQGFAVIFGI